jgi:hypothetical protein
MDAYYLKGLSVTSGLHIAAQVQRTKNKKKCKTSFPEETA